MRTFRLICLGGALALASTAAWAFQEQQGAVPGAAPAKPAAAAPAPSVNLGDAQLPAAKSSGGTEVRIPGLGRLGVLPKMDFGLELLYGATETKQLDEPRGSVEPGSDDLTIRGTLRRKF